MNADFQKIKGARQKKGSNAAEFIGQQPKYSITGLTPRSAVILRRHLGDPSTKYVCRTLREYFKAFRPKQWLFEGQHGHLHQRTLATILNNAAEKAQLNKHVSPHTLRHCFATHLLEQGVSLQVIQQLLGHSSIKTTAIYTHVTSVMLDKVVSPFDVGYSGSIKKNRRLGGNHE